MTIAIYFSKVAMAIDKTIGIRPIVSMAMHQLIIRKASSSPAGTGRGSMNKWIPRLRPRGMTNFWQRRQLATPTILIVLSLFLRAPAAQAATPQLPQLWIDTTYTPSVCTVTLPSGGDLQAAIDNASLGDTICLAQGGIFTGNYVLRNKTTGSGWITIRTSAPDSALPPPGTRILPSNINVMATITGPATGASSVITTEAGAHHYRFIGIEFTASSPDSTVIYNLIWLEGDYPNQTTVAQEPHHIIFDRVYAHGRPMQEIRRAFALNGAWIAVIDSYISEIHNSGFDSQTIDATNGTGPFKIVNNFLEASTENLCFGGAPIQIPNASPSDIEIRHNHFYKPLRWKHDDPSYDGDQWRVKNLFELKHAQRVLVDGNLFENNWPPDQSGFAILFQGLPSDSSLWAVVKDVTFTHNIVRHTAAGISLCGGCMYTPVQTTDPNAPNYADPTIPRVDTVEFSNNLFDDVRTDWGSGIFLQPITHSARVTASHNTVLNGGPPNLFDGPPNIDLTEENNIMGHGLYGVFGNSTGEGTASLSTFNTPYVFQKNVLAATPASSLSATYPPNNFLIDSWAGVGFVNPNNENGGDYHLLPSSPYKNAGTDGKDLGADMDAILAATAGVTDGSPGPVFVPPTIPNQPTTTVGSAPFSPVVYPNPWRSDKHAGKQITFSPVVVGGTIKIFTTSGRKVKEISVTNSTMPWNLDNDKGDKIASGIYVYLITDGQGNKAKGKLAVIK